MEIAKQNLVQDIVWIVVWNGGGVFSYYLQVPSLRSGDNT